MECVGKVRIRLSMQKFLLRAVCILIPALLFFQVSQAQQSYGVTTCSGVVVDFNEPGSVAGETYTWSSPIISPAGAISNGVALAGQSSVKQTLVNTTNVIAATATYTVTTSTGINFQLVITVNPVPVVSNILSTICSDIFL